MSSALQTPPTESVALAEPADPLASAVAWVARWHGRPTTAQTLTAGLPLGPLGVLSPDLIAPAAERCGLIVERRTGLPSTLPDTALPAVIAMSTGVAHVITRLDRIAGQADVIDAAHGGIGRTVSLDALDRDVLGAAFVFRPMSQSEGAVRSEAFDAAPGAARRWLARHLWQLWPQWLQVLIAACLINLLGLAMPLFVMQVYDRVLPNQAMATLWALTAGVSIAVIFELLLRQLRSAVLDHAGQVVDVKIGASLMAHVLALPMSARRGGVGGLANQMREFETVRDFFTSASVIALTDLLFLGIVVGAIWLVAGPLAWLVLAAVPIVLLLTLATLVPLGRAVNATLVESSRRHGILIESLAQTETLKALNAEGVMQRRFEQAIAATARANAATRLWSSFALNATMLVQQAIGIGLIVWGVFLVNDGAISVGALIAASMLSGRALAPLANIAMTITRAQQAFVAMRGVGLLFEVPNERGSTRAAGETIAIASIKLDHVTFHYPDRSLPALKDVSLSIAPGERIGIVGRVGSGKSTLGRLLARLYQPETGTIRLGERDAADLGVAEVRAAVGYVAQDTDLFDGTLRDNLTLGHRAASDGEIAEALRIAGADDFVATHPLGLSLPIAERGGGLSGGQRQAVGLARALLRRPKILFLDEPTSAMDTGSEGEFVRRMSTWCHSGRVLVVATHRLQLLDLCDRLIVLDGGGVVADGPKASVLARLGAAVPSGRAP